MRAALDLAKIGPRTVWIDCDVLQADGGTRTASITGGYVALSLALAKLKADGLLEVDPIVSPVAAVSVGVVKDVTILDLPYVEDVAAEVDMNLVINSKGEFIELQGTGEKDTLLATVDPAVCSHPNDRLKRRRDKSAKWWTCTRCQRRWDRLPLSQF